MEERTDYYQIGSREDIVVSSSSLKYINPEEGGNPVDFINFLEEGSEVESRATRLGTLVHKWHEDRAHFRIAEVPKPSEKLGLIADKIIDLIKQGGYGSDQDYEYAIREIGYYSNRWSTGMAKLIQDVKASCDEYVYEFLSAKENNLIFLTSSEVEPIINACQAIENHPRAKNLLFYQDNGIDDVKVYTEVEIYLTWPVEVKIAGEYRPIDVKFKAKVDKLIVNLETKTITIIDLKTTSKGVYYYGSTNFRNYKTYRQLSFYGFMSEQFICKTLEVPELGPDWNWEYKIVAVETNKSQQCVVYNISEGWIQEGMKEINKIVKRIAWHQYHNQWSYSVEETRNNYELDIPYVENNKI